jgi:hypothetical protein
MTAQHKPAEHGRGEVGEISDEVCKLAIEARNEYLNVNYTSGLAIPAMRAALNAAIAALTQPRDLPEGHPQAPMPAGWLTLAVPCGDGRHFVHGPEIAIEACRAALSLPRQSEAVRWEYRCRFWNGAPWGLWATYGTEEAMREAAGIFQRDGWEVETRTLYTAPPAAQGVVSTPVEATEFVSADGPDSGSYMFPNCNTPWKCNGPHIEAQADTTPAAHGVGDDRVLWGVVANAGRLSDERKPRWSHVVEATGQGSTSAAELCRRFGFDPDETIGGERCESGDPECGPVEFHDVEGVPLCKGCWEQLAIDSMSDEDTK